MAEFKTNPNQNWSEKKPIPKYNEVNKMDTVFSQINVRNMGLAMQDLTNSEFRVWCYFAKNAVGVELAISPAHAEEWGGISKSSFHKAFTTLKEKGYIVPKEGTTAHYYFYERPEGEEKWGFIEKKPSNSEEFREFY